MIIKAFLFCLSFLIVLGCSADQGIVNFDHLNHLTETISLNGKLCDIVHIYAESPDYQRFPAAGEGIACVDDVARAAVVHLRHFELSGESLSLEKAKRLINFVRCMQADDGEFYNFIHQDHTINRTGRTSLKSFNFWAVRGYWALALGYRMFRNEDRAYADTLKQSFLRCKLPLLKLLENYDHYEEIQNRRYPQWLVNGTGADASSIMILALVEFLKVKHDPELEGAAVRLAEGMIAMQVRDSATFDGAFLSWIDLWHAWGNSQTAALAALGQVLNKGEFIQAGKREADRFYTQLLIRGMIAEWQVSTNRITNFPQIAYAIRPMVVGLLQLHRATTRDDYAKLAGLAASWLLGNNAAQSPMYDSSTGRGYDGLQETLNINMNSGAESTIEALYTLIEVTKHPIANKYLRFRYADERYQADSEGVSRTFVDDEGHRLRLFFQTKTGDFRIEDDSQTHEN